MSRRPSAQSSAQPSAQSPAQSSARATLSFPLDRPGAVYLLPHFNRKRFKVGWSHRPLQRIQQLPEFAAKALDLRATQVAWFSRAQRAHEVEQLLHRGLAPYSVELDHRGDGHTEWFDTRGFLLARRIIVLMPAAGSRDRPNRTPIRLQLLSEAEEAPAPGTQALLPREPGALDAWYRIEDLWLRLGEQVPLALELDSVDRNQRCLLWLGLRRLDAPRSFLLRSRTVNLETYQWHEDGQRRSLVTLMDWHQDDLALHLVPGSQLRRWGDGDIVADLLRQHLARHAIPLHPERSR